MNSVGSAFEIEPTGESGGYCDCCATQTRTIWGWVHAAEGTVAAYFFHWTVGKSFDSHPANFDLIHGAWGETATPHERCAVSMLYFENEKGPHVMVIDAKDRPVANSELAGSALRRDEIISTPLAPRVFAIFDAVLTQDPRLT